MGWINTARYKWAELMGNEIKFKPATFYLGIVDHLAKAVEGLKPEDVAEERKGGLRRGHGELLDGVSHGPFPVDTGQATMNAEEGSTGLPSTKEPSGTGVDKVPGQSTILGPGNS